MSDKVEVGDVERCVDCGHRAWLSQDDGSGICTHIIDDPVICGHRCTFPVATPSLHVEENQNSGDEGQSIPLADRASSPLPAQESGLQPCPFFHKVIAGVALVTWQDSEAIGGRCCAVVECYDCHARGENFCLDRRRFPDTANMTLAAQKAANERAIAAWNNRASDASKE